MSDYDNLASEIVEKYEKSHFVNPALLKTWIKTALLRAHANGRNEVFQEEARGAIAILDALTGVNHE